MYICKMVITLSDHTLAAQDLGEKEIKQELALALYARGRVSLIQAADLAEIGFFEFQQLLKERSIAQHYSADDLAVDQETLAVLP